MERVSQNQVGNFKHQPGSRFNCSSIALSIRRFTGLFIIVAAASLPLLLTACGSNTPTPAQPNLSPTVTGTLAASTGPVSPAVTVDTAPPLPPAEIISRASAVFSSLQSYYLVLDIRTGRPQVKGLEVRQAEGFLQAPDRYDVKIQVALLVVEFKIPVVGRDGQQHMRGDNGGWSASTAEEKLDLPAFFNPQSGVGPTLAKVRDPLYLGTVTLSGRPMLHLQGGLTGKDIEGLTLHKLGSRDVTVEGWFDPETFRLTQLSLKETGPNGAYWIYNFSKFNEPVNIQIPGK